MSRTTRGGLLLVVCLILVASLVLTGCGKKKEAALQQPGLEFTQYIKGSTVDFDDTTFNTMSDSGGEGGFKYGIMKAIYPTIWDTNKDTVAQTLFPAPYWRGDGVHTYYSYLTSADQSAVDANIFATKLSAAEQTVVLNAIEGFFALYADETAAAKALEQNTAYGILAYKVSADAANAWKADATAWMTALNSYASANYGGKTYAQLTYIQRATVNGIVFANGAGTINPEYAFWRAMVKDSFRNGNASATYPDVAEARATALYGKSYSALNPCSERPVVDAAVWGALTAGQQANVTQRIDGLFTLSTEQVNGINSDNTNIYYTTLRYGLSDNLTITDNATQAADNWYTLVHPTAPGTSENTSFYAQLKYGPPQWKSALAYQYFGTDNYDALSPASKLVVDQADLGMDWLSIAQRSDSMPLTSNILYQTLYASVSSTAAAGWATDVGAGMNRELALYKWMAYESFRNGTAATFYPTQLAANVPAGKTYATMTSCEQLPVNAAVWAALGVGEQDYVQGSTGALVGMWNKVQAEMTDAVAIDQTYLSMTLRGSSMWETPVAGFKTDVEAGTLVRTAFYRWLAKESVKEMGSAALLIRQTVNEFYFKITNPNKYGITIDEAVFHFQTTVGSNQVIDGARQELQNIYVPAAEDKDTPGEVTLKVLAPTKLYDVVAWLSMAGAGANALTYASDLWSKIQNSTDPMTVEDWIYTADMQVSHGDEIQNYSYPE